MSDHHHGEYAEARHDHRGEYADGRHDHDLDYAGKHHRHYDDERAVDELRQLLGEVREELRGALERIRQLEEQTPQARQAEYEADVALADVALADLAESGYDDEPWRSTLADYQVASGPAEYADEELPPVLCVRVIMTGNGPRQCRLPVDHEPDAACPGNPHARPGPGPEGSQP